jgi:hypothetical protein
MLTTSLRDAHQRLSIAARELAWDKPDPGGEMTPILELRPVTDSGNNGRGSLGSHALDLGDALTRLTVAKDLVDLLVEHGNPAIQIAKEIIELGNGAARHGRQTITTNGSISFGSGAVLTARRWR